MRSWPGSLLLASLALPLALLPAPLAAPGVVTDATGAGIAGAAVQLKNAAGSVLSESQTDAHGRYSLPDLPAGIYQLQVTAEGFAPREIAVFVKRGVEAPRISLEPQAVYTRVTVSATRGMVDEERSSPQVTSVKDAEDIARRPLPTVGHVLAREPGILVQQSTYGQASPFLRGLTGYHVLNLIDGIRLNNSTFRSGPNQYLAFVEPSQAQRVEAVLGPGSSQFGSDSLGGTIHVITPEARFAAQPGWETHADFAISGATADLSSSGHARLSLGSGRFSWLLGASGRQHNDLRAGGGADSRNVFRRLFGLEAGAVRELLGDRQQDTGFRQYGLQSKIVARIRPDQLVSLFYQRGVQAGVRGYRDLLGGLGRLQSAFAPQVLNWSYARYEKLGLGGLDSLSGTFSVNSQTDGAVQQSLRSTDPITRERSRVDAYGYSVQATTHWTGRALAAFGGDIHDERIHSRRFVANPVSGTGGTTRPLYPDGSTYQTYGVFGQGRFELSPRLSAGVGGRLTGIRVRTRADSACGVPDSLQWFRGLAFNTSMRWQVTRFMGIHALVSRGFRAPNMNDLGAIGLSSLGYEIPVAEALPAGALLSRDAGEGALAKGAKLKGLRPERLLNYELGVRLTGRRLYARVQAFDAELHDPITRRTLLFPAINVPSQLAGIAVTPLPQTAAQRQQGVIAVATALDPRAVKAFVNDGRARYYGIESLARCALSGRWSVEANYSFLVGRDLDPNQNARRLPPQAGSAAVRYVPSGRRPWFEVSLTVSGAQERLSGGDRDDVRIGASRTRRDIADFFHGSRVQAYVDPASGVFRPTGEMLRQIQDRVLPIGATSNGVSVVDDNTRVPLYLATAGWATVNLHSGVPLGERWRLLWALENLLDRNYRVHGSGVDAPGITGYVSLRFTF